MKKFIPKNKSFRIVIFLISILCLSFGGYTVCRVLFDPTYGDGLSNITPSIPEGSGTSSNPYRVTNANEFVYMKNLCNSSSSSSKYFNIINDIYFNTGSFYKDGQTNMYSYNGSEFIVQGPSGLVLSSGPATSSPDFYFDNNGLSNYCHIEGNNKTIYGYASLGSVFYANNGNIQNIKFANTLIIGDYDDAAFIHTQASGTAYALKNVTFDGIITTGGGYNASLIGPYNTSNIYLENIYVSGDFYGGAVAGIGGNSSYATTAKNIVITANLEGTNVTPFIWAGIKPSVVENSFYKGDLKGAVKLFPGNPDDPNNAQGNTTYSGVYITGSLKSGSSLTDQSIDSASTHSYQGLTASVTNSYKNVSQFMSIIRTYGDSTAFDYSGSYPRLKSTIEDINFHTILSPIDSENPTYSCPPTYTKNGNKCVSLDQRNATFATIGCNPPQYDEYFPYFHSVSRASSELNLCQYHYEYYQGASLEEASANPCISGFTSKSRKVSGSIDAFTPVDPGGTGIIINPYDTYRYYCERDSMPVIGGGVGFADFEVNDIYYTSSTSTTPQYYRELMIDTPDGSYIDAFSLHLVDPIKVTTDLKLDVAVSSRTPIASIKYLDMSDNDVDIVFGTYENAIYSAGKDYKEGVHVNVGTEDNPVSIAVEVTDIYGNKKVSVTSPLYKNIQDLSEVTSDEKIYFDQTYGTSDNKTTGSMMGSGTSSSPYVVKDRYSLIYMANHCTTGKYYTFTNDIYLNNGDFDYKGDKMLYNKNGTTYVIDDLGEFYTADSNYNPVISIGQLDLYTTANDWYCNVEGNNHVVYGLATIGGFVDELYGSIENLTFANTLVMGSGTRNSLINVVYGTLDNVTLDVNIFGNGQTNSNAISYYYSQGDIDNLYITGYMYSEYGANGLFSAQSGSTVNNVKITATLAGKQYVYPIGYGTRATFNNVSYEGRMYGGTINMYPTSAANTSSYNNTYIGGTYSGTLQNNYIPGGYQGIVQSASNYSASPPFSVTAGNTTSPSINIYAIPWDEDDITFDCSNDGNAIWTVNRHGTKCSIFVPTTELLSSPGYETIGSYYHKVFDATINVPSGTYMSNTNNYASSSVFNMDSEGFLLKVVQTDGNPLKDVYFRVTDSPLDPTQEGFWNASYWYKGTEEFSFDNSNNKYYIYVKAIDIYGNETIVSTCKITSSIESRMYNLNYNNMASTIGTLSNGSTIYKDTYVEVDYTIPSGSYASGTTRHLNFSLPVNTNIYMIIGGSVYKYNHFNSVITQVSLSNFRNVTDGSFFVDSNLSVLPKFILEFSDTTISENTSISFKLQYKSGSTVLLSSDTNTLTIKGAQSKEITFTSALTTIDLSGSSAQTNGVNAFVICNVTDYSHVVDNDNYTLKFSYVNPKSSRLMNATKIEYNGTMYYPGKNGKIEIPVTISQPAGYSIGTARSETIAFKVFANPSITDENPGTVKLKTELCDSFRCVAKASHFNVTTASRSCDYYENRFIVHNATNRITSTSTGYGAIIKSELPPFDNYNSKVYVSLYKKGENPSDPYSLIDYNAQVTSGNTLTAMSENYSPLTASERSKTYYLDEMYFVDTYTFNTQFKSTIDPGAYYLKFSFAVDDRICKTIKKYFLVR